LLKHPEVVDYQVRQTACGVDVAVVSDGELAEAELARALRSALEGAGLVRPAISLCRVERLERNAETGKLRRFVPLER